MKKTSGQKRTRGEDRFIPSRRSGWGKARREYRQLGANHGGGASPLTNALSQAFFGTRRQAHLRNSVLFSSSPDENSPVYVRSHAAENLAPDVSTPQIKVGPIYNEPSQRVIPDFYSHPLAVQADTQLLAYSAFTGIHFTTCQGHDYAPTEWATVGRDYACSLAFDRSRPLLYAAAENLVREVDNSTTCIGQLGVKSYDLERRAETASIGNLQEPHYVLTSAPDGSLIAGNKTMMTVYDPKAGKISGVYKHSSIDQICSIQFSSEHLFAAGQNNGMVHLWDTRYPSKPVKSTPRHTAAVRAMAFSPSHSTIIATGGGAADRTMKIWEVTTGKVLYSVEMRTQVSEVLWLTPGRLATTHGFFGTSVQFWDIDSEFGIRRSVEQPLMDRVLSSVMLTRPRMGGDQSYRFFCLHGSSRLSGYKVSDPDLETSKRPSDKMVLR